MIIKCDNCNAKFKLNEDRIKGKGARVRCKKCGEFIIVMKPGFEHLKSHYINSISEKKAPSERPQKQEPPEKPEPEEEPSAKVEEEAPAEEAPSFEETGKAEERAPFGEIDETMVPADVEQKPFPEEDEKDDLDKAFEQYLESMKEEPLAEPPSFLEPDREEHEEEKPPVHEPGDVEEMVPGEFTAEQEKEREEPEAQEEESTILSTMDTLKFLSEAEKKEAGESPKKEFVLEEEKIDFSDALDFSSVIREKPEETPSEIDIPEPSFPREGEPAPQFEGEEAPEGLKDITGEEKPEEREPSKIKEPSPYEVVPRRIIKKKKKKAFATKFLVVLFLLMLVIAAGGAYLAFTERGNALLITYAPQIRALLGIQEKGKEVEFKITNLIGYYETNKKEGRLFVIKGEVVNLTKTPKSGLMVKGEILDEKGKTLSDKTVFAGNPISTTRLRSLSKLEIETILNNKLGRNLSNIDVQPGSSVPFMLVFFDLKGDVEAYRVECIE